MPFSSAAMHRARHPRSLGSGRAHGGLDGLALVLCLFCAALAACTGAPEGSAPAKIGTGWAVARLSPGHHSHITRGIKCEDCHGIKDGDFTLPPADACDTCHQDVRLHHAGDERASSDCTRCHAFTGELPPEAVGVDIAALGLDVDPPDVFFRQPDECLDCHEDAQGTHAAVVVHADQPCQDCHQPHGQVGLQPKSCTNCHQNVDLHHGRRSDESRPVHERCLDCHQPHGPAAGVGDKCPTCHSAHEPIIPATATFEGGHETCNGCHRTHDLRAAASSSCETCHEGHEALGAGRIQAHGTCTSCHNPHDVRQGAHDACKGCHTNQHTDHPAAHGALGACVTCHNPHPERPQNTTPQACSSCHGAMAQDHGHGQKDLACTQCHLPHSFVRTVQDEALCANCHKSEHTRAHANPGHTDCSNCHQDLPHHPKAGSNDCARCHSAQAPATTKHSACTSCHEPHGGTQAKACGQCHQTEHRSAPAGHAICTNCHNPHNANPRAPEKACAGCHAAEQQKNPHNGLATGCLTCHRPHGGPAGKAPAGPAQPPTCSSCHKPQSLGGLHAQAGHATCTSCHSPHDSAPRRDRENCTTCHKEQMNHQPGAKNCASCHLFRGGM